MKRPNFAQKKMSLDSILTQKNDNLRAESMREKEQKITVQVTTQFFMKLFDSLEKAFHMLGRC